MTPAQINKLRQKEEHRWSYMSENDLYKRLQRITVPEKLQMFRAFAVDHSNSFLIHAADEHQVKLVKRMGLPAITLTATPVKSGTSKPLKTDGRYLDI